MFRFLGNILWFIFIGLGFGLAWIFAGVVCCITIVGIPVGLQCFKIAALTFWPFGKEVVIRGGAGSFLLNILWIIFFGWELALGYVIAGAVCCITILAIPAGLQCFKLAKLSLMPFGAVIE